MDIRFASPAAGATFVSPGPITLKAGVSGSIKRVRFFANNVQIGSDDATAPFSREWKGMLSGLFELRAIGFDQKGRKVGEATSIVITVRAADPDPVPVPVDCVLSPWSDWSAWAPIDATTERRTRTRTVVTAPANGGAACAQTLETETRLIVVVEPPPVDPPPVDPLPPYPGGQRIPLTAADFTHVGSILLPDVLGVGQAIYSMGGLAFCREPGHSNDPTLFYASARSSDADLDQLVFQFLVGTPTTPASPEQVSSYVDATLLKSYDANTYKRGGVSKRTVTLNGATIPWSISSGPDWYGLYYDAVDSLLYWNYTATYSDGADADSKSFGYSALNYGGSTGVGHGPWGVTGHYARSIGGGMVGIPSWYADAYLAGKRLAVGVGGYGSICSLGASMGPKLVAIDAPGAAAEDSFLPGVELIGYTTCNGTQTRHAPRPAYAEQSFVIPGASALDSWTWYDTVNGACWIDTGTKHGVLFLATLGVGSMGYLSSGVVAEGGQNYWILANPMDFPPVSGGDAVDVPLTYLARDYQFDDPIAAPNTRRLLGTLGATMSTGGGLRYQYGTNVYNLPAHGYTGSSPEVGIFVSGNSRSEYNGKWEAQVIDADHLTVKAGNDISTWSGIAGSGGTAYLLNNNNTYAQHLGCAYDAVAKRLYVAVRRAGFGAVGGPRVFVDVWDVA